MAITSITIIAIMTGLEMEITNVSEILSSVEEMLATMPEMMRKSPDDLLLWRLNEGLIRLRGRLIYEQEHTERNRKDCQPMV